MELINVQINCKLLQYSSIDYQELVSAWFIKKPTAEAIYIQPCSKIMDVSQGCIDFTII